MRAEHACSRGLRGETILDSFDESGRVRVKALFIASHPQNVRLDILSPLGSVVVTLTANQRDFALLDQTQKAFHVGPALQCNVERFLKVPIPPAALVQLLSGEAPILVHEPEHSELSWTSEGYRIHLRGSDQAEQEILLELVDKTRSLPWQQQRVRVREVVLRQGGVELYRVELDDHRLVKTAPPRTDPDGIEADIPPSGPTCSAEIPHSVRFVVPVAGRDVVFKHQEMEHNPPLVPGTFEQMPPVGVLFQASQCTDQVVGASGPRSTPSGRSD